MELQLTTREVALSEEAHRYIEKKLGKLVRHLPFVSEAKVEINREKTRDPQNRYVVQVTLNCRGDLLRGEVRASALNSAIGQVANVLDRQIERYKGKLYKRAKKVLPGQPPLAQFSEEGEAPMIVKEKRFPLKPMSTEEAVEQMELLGHDFFLFLNTDNGKFSVLYKRHDGNYGLIEPNLG